ncbi:NlpC/P60 family protein [Flavobacteriaceae bacterium F08102]|nr:NlpC/P60 family protein [Flavobacteriaceae bacterium F08102]
MKITKILGFIFLVLLGSCGSLKQTANLQQTEKKLAEEYRKYYGVPYRFGGVDSNGFDCSGFVQTVYRDAFQIILPRTVKEMAKVGSKISKSRIKIGDLVFFRPSRKYRHVGIYVGNNQFMHSSTSQGIIKSDLDNVYWAKKYKFSRRILKK